MSKSLRSLGAAYITSSNDARRIFAELVTVYPKAKAAREEANTVLLHATCDSYVSKFGKVFEVRKPTGNRSDATLVIGACDTSDALAVNRAKNAMSAWRTMCAKLASASQGKARSIEVPRRAAQLYKEMAAAQAAFRAYLKAQGLNERDVVASIKAK